MVPILHLSLAFKAHHSLTLAPRPPHFPALSTFSPNPSSNPMGRH